ncbi:MAG TPA: response regulator [Anaerolineae bacterium]|nr:response regulator [Anaerolineae bacterium]
MESAGKRILIVDDDVELAALLRQALRDVGEGLEIQLARDADEALAKISRRSFDLVVTDIKMAGLNGLQLVEILRQLDPTIKTIAMTAYSSAEVESQARALDVYRYIAKPFTIEEFRRIVREALAVEESAPVITSNLSDAQRIAVEEHLMLLRASTQAHIVFLVNSRGRPVCVDSLSNGLDVTNLCNALVTSNAGLAAEVERVIGRGRPFTMSYHGGPDYSICSYGVGTDHLLVTVFNGEIRVGQVWYYMKDAAGYIQAILESKEQPGREAAAEEMAAEVKADAGVLPQEAEPAEAAFDLLEEAAVEAGRDFGGLSFAEAMEKGLLGEEFLRALGEG